MANINLTRTVEYSKLKIWIFTKEEEVKTVEATCHKTSTGLYELQSANSIAAGYGGSLIKYEVIETGVHLMTLPLRDYVAIAEIKEEKAIKKADTETADQEEN